MLCEGNGVFFLTERVRKPLSLENLEGISSDGVRDGDYFYYKHTVKPGEKVELFQGIRIPWEWKTPDEDNVWKACVRAEAIQAEYFSPNFTGKIRGG